MFKSQITLDIVCMHILMVHIGKFIFPQNLYSNITIVHCTFVKLNIALKLLLMLLFSHTVSKLDVPTGHFIHSIQFNITCC